MAIQTGQVLKQITTGISTGRTEPKQTGAIQTGRVLRGMTSYDENIRQGIISDIESQKEAIRQQNLEIEQQNAEMKATYNNIVNKIKNMTVEEYDTFYTTIPNNLKNLFQTPEQIKQNLADEKIQLAKDLNEQIDKRIKENEDKVALYTERINKLGDTDEAREYDRLRVEAQIWADSYALARQYATGDYTSQSVNDFIGDTAQNRIDRNWANVAEDRLRKVEEANLIEQYKKEGLEPVYTYPNSQLQTLIGFKQPNTNPDISSWYKPVISPMKTTKTTNIPQNVLSLGTSKVQAQKVNQEKINQDYLSNRFKGTTTEQVTLAVDRDTGRIAAQYKLNTSTANLEDHTFKKINGVWVDVDAKKVYKTTSKNLPANKVNPRLSKEEVLIGQTDIFGIPLNPLELAISKNNLKETNILDFSLGNIKLMNIPISQQRGTIGASTNKIVPSFTSTTLAQDITDSIGELNQYITKGAESFSVNVLKQPITQDIYFNLPQQTRGTSILNPQTLKYEIPKIESQKTTVPTIFGTGAKVIGAAPELAAWTFIPEAMAIPYAVRGGEVALNPSLSSSARIGGAIETGGALAFGYGGRLLKALPKSKVIIETTKLKVPSQEGVIGVSQVNPVEIYTDIYGNQITKYGYKVKSIVPEVAESTGQVTKVYKQSVLRDMFGFEPKKVYEGNPFTDKLGYNKAIEQIKTTGLTEAQAKARIRLTAPKYAESKVSGEAFALFGEETIPKTFLKAQQTVTPKIIDLGGVKTRSFESENYFIKSKGIEAGTKGDVLFYKSLPEYTKTYMKDGAVFSKLKQAGKTTEVFEQLTGIKSLGTREFKSTVSDIGYAQTYVPKELEAFKDVSVSRKIIPKERKLLYGKSNILTSNIEEPIIITYDAPFKVTKEIDTGSVTGTTLKKGEMTEQQKLINNLGREGTVTNLEYKPLTIVKEAKNDLYKEQQRVSSELIKQQVPQVPIEIKQTKIKPLQIIKEVKSSAKLPTSSLGIGTNMFEDLTGQGKIKGLGTTGKIGSLGVLEGRLGTTSLAPIVKEDTGYKFIEIKGLKEDLGSINKIKQPQKEETQPRFKQPSQPKYKQPELFKYKQPQVLKQPDIFKTPTTTTTTNVPETNVPKVPRIPKLPPIFKESKQLTKKQEEVLSKAFTVLIRSKGKILEIGKGLPYGKALKLGVSKSKSSLAQTFALRESGTTRESDISYRVPANLFTTPKRKKTYITPETWVEKRGTTLSFYPEVKGIQQEKKIKQRKLKWL